jgi:hypothetical protein
LNDIYKIEKNVDKWQEKNYKIAILSGHAMACPQQNPVPANRGYSPASFLNSSTSLSFLLFCSIINR